MLLQKIHKNMNVEGIKKLSKMLWAFIPGKYKDFKSAYYLKRVSEKKNTEKNKIKVGFIVQAPEIWDKSVDVYNEMKTRNDVEPFLLVVPSFNWAEGKLERLCEDNFFIKTYPDAIRTLDDEGNLINVKTLELDYVFYPRPYDHYLPFELRSSQMMMHTRCCYIPYGFSGADIFNEGNTNKEFFRNMYMTFLESDYMRKIFEKKYKKRHIKNIQHFESLGYPCLEKFLKMDNESLEGKKTILWTPRWSYDERIGGSNFFEYKDYMVQLHEKFPDVELVFRPHPMMFEEMLRTKRMSKEEIEKFKDLLEKKGIYLDVGTPINEAIEKADVLVTDYSSIIIMFFLTGKPIVYCESNIKFNEVLEKVKECIYVVNCEEELEMVLSNINRGNDYLKEKRYNIINSEFSNYKETTRKIVDRLISDYFRCHI